MTPAQQAIVAVAMSSAIPVAVTLLFAAGVRGIVGWVPRLVPFAVGAMVGAAVFNLIPEALERSGATAVALVVAIGIAAFHLIERFTHGRSDHHRGPRTWSSGRLALTITGDATHNLIDGILVATTFLEQPAVGLLTAVAVALHEIPRELGTFALCVSGGLRVRTAVAITVATSVLAVLGAVLVVALGAAISELGLALVPFAAGNFLYLAGSIVWGERDQLRKGGGAGPFVTLIAVGLIVTFAASRW